MKKLLLTLCAVSFSLAVSAQGWGPTETTYMNLPLGVGFYTPDITLGAAGDRLEGLVAFSFPDKGDPISYIQSLLPYWVRITDSSYWVHDSYYNNHYWHYDLEILPMNGSNNPRVLKITWEDVHGNHNESTITQFP